MTNWRKFQTLIGLAFLIPFMVGGSCIHTRRSDPSGNGDVALNNDDIVNRVPWDERYHFVNASFSGPSTLTCTGDYLLWENVGYFTPSMKLNKGPAEKPLTLKFDIQGAKDIGSDRLGLLEATWNTGDTYASSFRYATQAPASGTTVPEGATTLTDGFWLGCTKICAVRGNAGKTGPDARDVFIQSRDNKKAQVTGGFRMVVGCEDSP